MIVYLDADGTLFHHTGYIPQSAFAAIKKAQENGHLIVLCTGRQLVEIYGDLKKIDYDAIVAGAGGTVTVNDQLLYDAKFTQEQLKDLQLYLNKHRIPAVYESRIGVFASNFTKEAMLARLEEVCKGLSDKEKSTHGMTLFYKSVEQKEEEKILKDPISKISFLQTEKPYREIYEDLHQYFDLIRATFAPLGPESGEIGCQGVSKAHGMQIVEEHFHIPLEQTIAIGDGENDLCMFEHAHISVAMGNAKDCVKEKADFVTTDLEEDGILHAFEALHLI